MAFIDVALSVPFSLDGEPAAVPATGGYKLGRFQVPQLIKDDSIISNRKFKPCDAELTYSFYLLFRCQ